MNVQINFVLAVHRLSYILFLLLLNEKDRGNIFSSLKGGKYMKKKNSAERNNIKNIFVLQKDVTSVPIQVNELRIQKVFFLSFSFGILPLGRQTQQSKVTM